MTKEQAMKLDKEKKMKKTMNEDSTMNDEVEEKITDAGDVEFSDDELDSMTNKMIFGSKKSK